MATIVLSAVGAAAGAGFGGTLLGLSGAVIGRAAGATLGRVIDQRLLGSGSEAVETGKVDRFRLTGASEGAPIGLVFGRVRLPGQVIWATRFRETAATSGGGKGAPRPTVTTFSYTVSLAIALCEGRITRVGRVWADGSEIARDELNLRVYDGSPDQLPDPKIEAVEGAGAAPAYRGVAYVVIEDLMLAPFGNRVPQFSFEVLRPAAAGADTVPDMIGSVQAVAMMPGTGEYALATTPVHFADGPGISRTANMNTPSGKTDLVTSLAALREELPDCRSVSLIVSWFGSDLRCGTCRIKPKVEQRLSDGVGMPWQVSGVGRGAAEEIVRQDGRSVYGGTPADRSVVEAIRAIRAGGQQVMFYPFVLMEQVPGNGLRDPYTGAPDQPPFPWRGRITTSKAPGAVGTPDRTALAATEVAAFFGSAAVAAFQPGVDSVAFTGGADWGYRRFILHYAHLAALAGGVDAFCIGSEMRGLTHIRGAGDSFPAVAALVQLAAEVRVILGPATKISYAADWSEYASYNAGGGNLYFHLDPLWASPNIDFIGIDNYMPIADWRSGYDHADAAAGSIYNIDYLKSNIAGGEGFDWYYANPSDAAAQIRTPITDGAYGEPWVYRVKDLRAWWSNPHRPRLNGIRQATASAWVPQSKPIWFTELGCAAIDKGANQPNLFLDPKSSESALPRFSDGRRDDLMQMQYLRATADYWRRAENNPVSAVTGKRMVDADRAHVWAWDARPFPYFPNQLDVWSDGGNYARGHWITGRTSGQPLASVVAEICRRSGVTAFDVSGLYGLVRGYVVSPFDTARAALQPLMLIYGFEAVEREGVLTFKMREGRSATAIEFNTLVAPDDGGGGMETTRAPVAEVAGRVRLTHIGADGDFDARSAEAVFPDDVTFSVSQSEMAIVLTEAEGRGAVERWLAEARVARDTARFRLPPSAIALGAGDVVALDTGNGAATYRLDRVEQAGALAAEAVRVEPAVYIPSDAVEERVAPRRHSPLLPVYPLFLDLPLMTGQEVPHAPHVAVTATPWPGQVAVYSAVTDEGYELNSLVMAGARIGVTQSPLARARPGIWDNGAPLRIRLFGGTLAAVTGLDVLNGANTVAIGDGSPGNWEVFQFMSATLVGPEIYDIAGRLRGQVGTDAIAPEVWPIGSQVVVIDPSVTQINLAQSARGLARHYRIGVARRAYDDPSYLHLVAHFDGIGLRPLSPCHVRATRGSGGAIAFAWIRRGRVDADSWSSTDVPLGEDREGYVVRVRVGGAVVREAEVSVPAWTYGTTEQTADGVTGAAQFAVAQLSSRFGPGPFQEIMFNV